MALVVNERQLRIRMAQANPAILSLRALAKESGLSYKTVLDLVNGDAFSSPSIDKMARALGCHPLDILDDRSVPEDAAPHAGAPALATV